MVPWTLLDSAELPGSKEGLRLFQRGAEFSIRVGGRELMNSRLHGSEDALAELAAEKLDGRARPRVLVGGLGLGFTLAASLKVFGKEARVVVAELVPAVVRWNREILAPLAGRPLDDRRVTVCELDVAQVIREQPAGFDAILLDVDNGPEGLTQESNQWLYGPAGLRAAHAALRPRGVLGVWSSGPSTTFIHRLRKVGFEAKEIVARARGAHGGARHVIWLAVRPS